jgi:hypothetical protein
MAGVPADAWSESHVIPHRGINEAIPVPNRHSDIRVGHHRPAILIDDLAANAGAVIQIFVGNREGADENAVNAGWVNRPDQRALIPIGIREDAVEAFARVLLRRCGVVFTGSWNKNRSG